MAMINRRESIDCWKEFADWMVHRGSNIFETTSIWWLSFVWCEWVDYCSKKFQERKHFGYNYFPCWCTKNEHIDRTSTNLKNDQTKEVFNDTNFSWFGNLMASIKKLPQKHRITTTSYVTSRSVSDFNILLFFLLWTYPINLELRLNKESRDFVFTLIDGCKTKTNLLKWKHLLMMGMEIVWVLGRVANIVNFTAWWILL